LCTPYYNSAVFNLNLNNDCYARRNATNSKNNTRYRRVRQSRLAREQVLCAHNYNIYIIICVSYYLTQYIVIIITSVNHFRSARTRPRIIIFCSVNFYPLGPPQLQSGRRSPFMMLLKSSHTHTHTPATVTPCHLPAAVAGLVVFYHVGRIITVTWTETLEYTYRVIYYIYCRGPPTIAPSQKEKRKNRPVAAALARPVYCATAFQILSVVYRCTFPSRFRPSSPYTWGYDDVSRTDCRPTEISTITWYLCGSWEIGCPTRRRQIK